MSKLLVKMVSKEQKHGKGSNVCLEFSIGPGIAGQKSKHVDKAVEAFQSVGLNESSNGFVSEVRGPIGDVASALASAIVDAFDHGATHFRAVIRDDLRLSEEAHEYVKGIEHVVTSLGGQIVSPSEALPQDTPLEWQNQIVAAVRQPAKAKNKTNLLIEGEPTLIELAEEHFGALDQLPKKEKLQVISWLDRRDAFQIRKSVSALAVRMKISRATAYNYLKVVRDDNKVSDS